MVKKAIFWAPKRLLAEAAGDPRVFFEQPEEQELLAKMRTNPEDTLNLFGKKKKSRKVHSNKELTKINKMIAAIDKLIC